MLNSIFPIHIKFILENIYLNENFQFAFQRSKDEAILTADASE